MVTDSVGLKLHEVGGNRVTFLNNSVSGFDKGFFITGDWAHLIDCIAYVCKTGFRISDENTTGTRPIQAVLDSCFSLSTNSTAVIGFDHVAGEACLYFHPTVETGPETPSTFIGFRIAMPGNYPCAIINPEFQGPFPVGATRFDFETYYKHRCLFRSGVHLVQRGSATIVAGNTYVDVTHNLDQAPDIVKLTPTTDTVDKRWWVSSKGASTFRIEIDSFHTADISFDWEAII